MEAAIDRLVAHVGDASCRIGERWPALAHRVAARLTAQLGESVGGGAPGVVVVLAAGDGALGAALAAALPARLARTVAIVDAGFFRKGGHSLDYLEGFADDDTTTTTARLVAWRADLARAADCASLVRKIICAAGAAKIDGGATVELGGGGAPVEIGGGGATGEIGGAGGGVVLVAEHLSGVDALRATQLAALLDDAIPNGRTDDAIDDRVVPAADHADGGGGRGGAGCRPPPPPLPRVALVIDRLGEPPDGCARHAVKKARRC